MSGEPSLERIERSLTAAEKRWLRLQLTRLDCRRYTVRRSLYATGVVTGPLWFLTLVATRNQPISPVLVSLFWLGIAIVISVTRGWSERAENRRRRTAVIATLEHDRAVEMRVRCGDVLRIAEFDDCGDSWLFEVGSDTTLVLSGQTYYEDERFPTSEFSIVDIKQAGERTFKHRIVPRGSRVHARHTFPASAVNALEWLEEETVIQRALRDLERELGRAPPGGRYR